MNKSTWKDIALEKQLKFKKETLKYTESGVFGKKNKEYENILSDADARKGGNFYCYNLPEEWQALKDWSRQDKGKRVDFVDVDLKNMIQCEHIPYNMFFPLEQIRQNKPELLNRFLEGLLGNTIKVDQVFRIKIGFASDLNKTKLLDDNTSFNVYVEYLDGADKCGLGIEIKYTEKSSPYSKIERKRMFDQKDSEYNRLSRESKYYIEGKRSHLKDDKLKQLWKNHLLGLKLVELKELHQFRSVHLYPEGNTYQKEACEQYTACLKDESKASFVPITFERFTALAKEIFGNEAWIEYIEKRY